MPMLVHFDKFWLFCREFVRFLVHFLQALIIWRCTKIDKYQACMQCQYGHCASSKTPNWKQEWLLRIQDQEMEWIIPFPKIRNGLEWKGNNPGSDRGDGGDLPDICHLFYTTAIWNTRNSWKCVNLRQKLSRFRNKNLCKFLFCAGWHNLWGYRWTQKILKSYR